MDGISLIVPSVGKSKTLSLLLKSIEDQKHDFPIEVIFVLNKISQADFIKLKNQIENFSPQLNITCYFSNEAGVNRARNFGLNLAKYSIVFFSDDDCVFDDQYILQKHMFIHDLEKELFALGGRYALPPQAKFFDSLYNEIQMHWLSQGVLDERSDLSCYLIGGHFSAKKEILNHHQLHFDPQITYGGSELSIFKQAFQLKLKMRLLDIHVLHLNEESFLSLNKKIFKQGRGQAYLEQSSTNEFRKNQKLIIRTSFFKKTAQRYYSFIFWLGYFTQKRKKIDIFIFLFKNIKASFHSIKYGLLSLANQIINKKINNQDRF